MSQPDAAASGGRSVRKKGQYAARDLVSVPGLLSLARVPLGALFPLAVHRPPMAIGLLVIASVSDVADGWYARRFHCETATGRVLDPITDKIFVTTVAGTMIVSGALSVTEALMLGARELCELALLAWLAFVWRGRARPARGANRIGKIATVMQFITVAVLLLGTSHRMVWILATAACGTLAGLSYGLREWRDVRQAS